MILKCGDRNFPKWSRNFNKFSELSEFNEA